MASYASLLVSTGDLRALIINQRLFAYMLVKGQTCERDLPPSLAVKKSEKVKPALCTRPATLVSEPLAMGIAPQKLPLFDAIWN